MRDTKYNNNLNTNLLYLVVLLLIAIALKVSPRYVPDYILKCRKKISLKNKATAIPLTIFMHKI